jgi:hypothetical protein
VTNRLEMEISPYLRQHAANPVDWYPWGEEAFAAARSLDRPLFLSIGYAACHWCHVMAHESFEDPVTAALLNSEFVSVKVDREERPDVDAVYMDAVVMLTGQGGWPMSVFLTHEGEPFFGGTYFPPQARHGLPSFTEVLRGVARLWREERPRLRQAARQLADQLRRAQDAPPGDAPLAPDVLDRAAEGLFRTYDWTNGGWGGALKFPQPLAIEVLLERATRRGDALARDMALHALQWMSRGGIFDHLGGGFHRYAVERTWTVPHFEKMLYDNALLARAYLHAWQIAPAPALLRTFRDTMRFALSELRLPDGGFAASLDADTQGEEGRFYTWSVSEIREALPDARMAEAALARYGVSEAGHLDKRSVLTAPADPEAIALRLGLSPAELEELDLTARAALLARRQERVPPPRDDKVLTNWNGLILAVLAEAARAFPAQGYLEPAERLAEFLTTDLRPGGELMHVWRDGRTAVPAFLDDHASLALGLLALHQTDGAPRWLETAVELGEVTLRKFIGPEGGSWTDVDAGTSSLLLAPRALQDSPVPGGGALAAQLFALLHAFTGTARYAEQAARMCREIQDMAVSHPVSFASWLRAIGLSLDPPSQLVIVGGPGSPGYDEMLGVISPRYWPDLILGLGLADVSVSSPLTTGRRTLDGRATAYLCRHFVCQSPTNEPEALTAQLAALRQPPVAP